VIPDTPLGLVDKVMIVVAAMTGFRQGELIGLRWINIDWAVRKIRAPRGFVRGEYTTPKGKRGRAVPLADRAGGELDVLFKCSAFQDDHDLVFAHPETGAELDRSKLLKRFKRYLADAGVHEITWHELRHTFGTRMAARGVPLRTIQEWMGHRDIKTTQIYAHYAPSEHEVDWVNDAFAAASPGIGRTIDRHPT
jgi:integrase